VKNLTNSALVAIEPNMSTSQPNIDPNPPEKTLAKAFISNERLILRLVLVVAIAFAMVNIMGPEMKRVMLWGLVDNDDAMRVLQVRDWLAGQSWFDVSQHRLNPPEGGDMHWSRLADLSLAAFMAPLTAIFGPDLGAKYATFWAPIVGGVVYVWVGARTAKALGGQKAFLAAIVLVASAPAALSYFMPGRVDHHGLQMTLIAAALWGLFSSTRLSSLFAGVAIAAGIAVGLEALPLQIVLIAWVAARWGFRGEEVKEQTIGFGLGFGIALVVLFVATTPMAKWYLPVNDAIGRGYVVLGFAGGMLLALGAVFASAQKLLVRFSILVGIGVIVLAGITQFPEIIVPPYGKVDPLLVKLWLSNVNETKPLYSDKLSMVLSFAAFPALAVVGAGIAVFMTADKERDKWILAATAVLVAAGLAIFWQSRTTGLASALSSVIAAAMIAQALERFGWKAAIGFGLIVNPVVPVVVAAGIAKVFEPKETRFVTGGGQGCYNEPSFKSLAVAPKGLVVAPVDMGARILLTTHHQALAAPYHRNNKGNLAAYQVFIMPQDQAKARVAALGAGYVAICKKSAEVGILSREGPKGLMADLEAGRIPAWLEPMPTPKGSDILAFKVK
jgi:asparagine N-glycosylation enzyme membrane subunit Stt3